VFSGAGISCSPPACLPLGRRFHRDLLDTCLGAVDRLAPDLLSVESRLALRSRRWNVIARLAACSDPDRLPEVTSVLSCFQITVPTEAHLLSALHLAEGGHHVTVNFDNGIECAYALLSGRLDLPKGAQAAFAEPLAEWRAGFPPNAPPLRVAHRPADMADTECHPQLVKLRGTAGAPELLIGVPVVDMAESVCLGQARLIMFDALVATDSLLITGYSGEDLDCVEPLLARLRHGTFSWVAQHIDTDLAARLKVIDSRQPVNGDATAALRQLLGQRRRLPPWPTIHRPDPQYGHAFALWRRRLSDQVAAEACGWMLSDAGYDGPAVELFDRCGGRPHQLPARPGGTGRSPRCRTAR